MTTRLADVVNALKLYQRGLSGKPIGFSFDIADRCPIHCDCYWRAQARVTELSNEQALAFFQERKAEGLLIATLVGGEPYVRPDLLALLTPIMPANWLVTSGTCPLKRYPHTTHFVSIDGADAETHDGVRKTRGLFERILKNLGKARLGGDFPVTIHTVLNALNYGQIEAILHLWSGNGLADSVVFSTHTPIKEAIDDRLRLSENAREDIVSELVRLKTIYGSFMVNTLEMINLLHPNRTQHQTPETCGTARLVPSFDASGAKKHQCILSDKADCSQCGCVITTMIEPVIRPIPDIASIRALARLRTR